MNLAKISMTLRGGSSITSFGNLSTSHPFYFLIIFSFRSKSFEKAFRLAIDLNDKDLFLLLQKCAKACNLGELMIEAKRRADEIFTKEEEDECESHREFFLNKLKDSF